MAGLADLVRLRQALDFIPSWISDSTTHARLASHCQSLGLPEPPPENAGSKFERALVSFTALPDITLPLLAERVLAASGLTPALSVLTWQVLVLNSGRHHGVSEPSFTT
jgi:hypothetical protein